MKNKVLKIFFILGCIILINACLTTISNGAISISTSKTSVSPGETFSVTVSVSGNEAGHITLSANNASLSKTDIDLMTASSATVSCTAGSSGTITINASGRVANYDTETETMQSATPRTVSIVESTPTTPSTPSTPTTQTKSSNANLSNLGINPYDFRGFKAATTSYSVSVPKSVSTINIYATAQHSKAKISGTGNKNLEIGRNTFNVVVTAEDGTKKTYTLYITRKADEEPVSEEPETPELTATGTLSTLAIEGIALTPEFNVEIKEYTVVIPEEMTEVNITATPIKETYNVQIEGGKDLKLGENTATISVSTEEGVIETYTIKIIRGKIKASLKSLAIGYLDINGKYIELKFTPIFKEDVLEYTIDNLEHIVNSLKIEAVPSKEEYTVEITGNEKLEDGRNVITIKVKNTTENEEIEEVEYKIIANRKKENKTGIIGKIKNAFTGFTGGIGEFIKNNNDKIVFYSIASCAVVMFGLSIYLIYDYKRYKMMLEKIRTLTRETASMRRNQVETVHENNENITE